MDDGTKVVIEMKATAGDISRNNLKQLHYYMHYLQIKVGYVINFKHDSEFPGVDWEFDETVLLHLARVPHNTRASEKAEVKVASIVKVVKTNEEQEKEGTKEKKRKEKKRKEKKRKEKKLTPTLTPEGSVVRKQRHFLLLLLAAWSEPTRHICLRPPPSFPLPRRRRSESLVLPQKLREEKRLLPPAQGPAQIIGYV